MRLEQDLPRIWTLREIRVMSYYVVHRNVSYFVLLHLSLLFMDSYSISISLASVIFTAFRCFGTVTM